jgi:hypothetical protein
MIAGSCLGGAVRFEVDRVVGPFELCHCSRCGSPVPDPSPSGSWFEIPAGALDGDPQIKPDRHIFVERKAPWFDIADGLPQFDKPTLYAMRRERPRDRS